MINNRFAFAVNALGFQGIWWSTMLFTDLAVIPVLLLVGLHILIQDDKVKEVNIILGCALLGFLTDTLLTLAGIFSFQQAHPPLWLLTLWIGFAATLRHSLSFFADKPLLAALAGSLFGTLSYLAANKLTVVAFPMGLAITSGILAVIWLVLFPVLFLLRDKLERHHAH